MGSAHSSISGVKQHSLLDIQCRSLQTRKKPNSKEPITLPMNPWFFQTEFDIHVL